MYKRTFDAIKLLEEGFSSAWKSKGLAIYYLDLFGTILKSPVRNADGFCDIPLTLRALVESKKVSAYEINLLLKEVFTQTNSSIFKPNAHSAPQYSAAAPLIAAAWMDVPVSDWDIDRARTADRLAVGRGFNEYMDSAAELKLFYDEEYDKVDDEFMRIVTASKEHQPKSIDKKGWDHWNSLCHYARCSVLGTWVFATPSKRIVRNILVFDNPNPPKPYLKNSINRDIGSDDLSDILGDVSKSALNVWEEEVIRKDKIPRRTDNDTPPWEA